MRQRFFSGGRMMKSLMDPDDFKYDWYGYAGNQGIHLIMGASTYLYLHVAYLWAFDTLAYRWHVLAMCLALYLIWEGVINKWYGWDSVEDTVFFAGYGAGIPAWCIKGVEGDCISVTYNIWAVAACVAIVWVHLLVGVAFRWRNERDAGRDGT